MNAYSNHFTRFLRSLAAAAVGCCLILPAVVSAQDQPVRKIGFVRLVNAVAQRKNGVEWLIDGESMNPDGYQLGDVTGGIGLSPGSHQITVKREGVEQGSTRIQVVVDDTTTLIPFAEKVPATDEKPAYWTIRILRLRQMKPETERTATFVSVSQTPQHEVEIRDPQGNWTRVAVKRLATVRTPIKYPEGYVPLRSKEGKLPPIPVGGPGNYVVVLYDARDGTTKALNLQDYKFLSAE
ncbi:MAG: hypothetical protein K9N23_17275 [Akkermansiaceae bacterium]|nr:hypothetical protein [Akkermansiaceae bacterium]